MATLCQSYLQTVIKRLRYYKDLGDKTFSQLSDEDFIFQPNVSSNSICIIIQHLSGNMLSRWTNFLTEDGEKEWRSRDQEFNTNPRSRQELLQMWDKGWTCMFDSLQSLREEDLMKTVYIRQEGLLVVDAINRQLAHYPYHVGQIVYIGRLIRDKQWENLSIPPGKSDQYNKSTGVKDPAKNY
jgi:hypothetical protein